MKKYIITILSAFMFFTVAGCSSKIEEDELGLAGEMTEEMEKIEISNVLTDANIFYEAYKTYMIEIDEVAKTAQTLEELNTKVALSHLKYMDSIYQLAISRINADIQGIHNDTDEYLKYIAQLQVFSESFSEEKDKLLQIANNDDKDYTYSKSVISVTMLEEFYLSVIKQVSNS